MDFNTGYQPGFLNKSTSHWLLDTQVKLYGSGRAAFVDSARYLKQKGMDRLWLPAWQCNELVVSLQAANHLRIEFYELNEQLVPSAEFLQKLNPDRDALLLVDYFASVSEIGLRQVLNQYPGPILLDAVHSWLLDDLSLRFSDQVTIFSGFRKLFWKVTGVIVTGGFSAKLPVLPCFIPEASPGFPRNISLSPRYGCLSKTLLSFNNLVLYDKLANNWPASEYRGIFELLRSPVRLAESVNHQPSSDWHWPDLYQGLTPQLRQHAEGVKSKFQVIKR